MEKNKITVYVLCEESQVVTNAFRRLGVHAWSVDILPTRGDPDFHCQMDAIRFLSGVLFGRVMSTQSGFFRTFNKPELVIAHPPCTYLSNAGRRWDYVYPERREKISAALGFFEAIKKHSCRIAHHVCIENPAGKISTLYRKPDQYVNPFQFGEPYAKKTGLWLWNLPCLIPTNVLERPPEGWKNQSFDKSGRNRGFNGSFRDPRQRSKTFEGIAKAMAEQWTEYICKSGTVCHKDGEKGV